MSTYSSFAAQKRLGSAVGATDVASLIAGKDGSGNAAPLAIGQRAMAASASVATASDDPTLALLGAVTETAPASDTASSGQNGRLQRIAQRLTTLIALIPQVLGQTNKAGSLSVALASNDDLITNIGAKTDAKSTATDGTSISIMQVLKQVSASVQLLVTGTVLAAGSALIGKVSPADDQDPIFDTVNGTKTSVTTNATILTPPTGCKYARIGSDTDIFVNTAGGTAADDAASIRIIANQPEIVPVVAGTAVKALSSTGTAVVRCMPLKVR